MRKVLLGVVALVVLVPVVEWVLLFQLARVLTWWGVLALLGVAAVAGLFVARRYGPGAWRQVKASRVPATTDGTEVLGMPAGPAPGLIERSTADRVLLTVAGLLLLFPGLLSDLLALLLLVPAVRARLLDTFLPRLARRAQRAMLRSLGLDDELQSMLMSDGGFMAGGGFDPSRVGGMGTASGAGPAGFGPRGPGRSTPPGGSGPGSGDVIDV